MQIFIKLKPQISNKNDSCQSPTPFTPFFHILFLYKFVYMILYKGKIMKITNSVTPADVQKNYRKIFNSTKKSGPTLVITHNRPDVIIMGYQQYVKLIKDLENHEYQETMDLLKSSIATSSNDKLKIFYSHAFQVKMDKLPLLIKKSLLKIERTFKNNSSDPTLTIRVYKPELPDTYVLLITENLAVVFKKETKNRVTFVNIINYRDNDFYPDTL